MSRRRHSSRQPRPNLRYRRLAPTVAIAAALIGSGGAATVAQATDTSRPQRPPALVAPAHAPSATVERFTTDGDRRAAKLETS